MIRMNIRIYSYQKNDTNMIRTNIRIGKYSNIRIFATPWSIVSGHYCDKIQCEKYSLFCVSTTATKDNLLVGHFIILLF